jgi:hypothetical protein
LADLRISGAAEPSWEFHLAFNVWAAGIEGTAAIAGHASEVDDSFRDLLEITNFGGSLHFEAHRRPWGCFGDAFYANLEEDASGPAGGTIHAETTQWILEAGAGYELVPKLEVLFGARYQSLEDDFTFPVPVGGLSTGRDWTDGFAGIRWTPVHTDKWLLWLRGDGGVGPRVARRAGRRVLLQQARWHRPRLSLPRHRFRRQRVPMKRRGERLGPRHRLPLVASPRKPRAACSSS